MTELEDPKDRIGHMYESRFCDLEKLFKQTASSSENGGYYYSEE